MRPVTPAARIGDMLGDGTESSLTVEGIFTQLRRRLPSISIERLRVTHPADDDNLWFIRAIATIEVQIETHPGGQPPFLIEGDRPEQRHETSHVAEAVEIILILLAS